MAKENLYYKESGKIGIASPIIMGITGILVSAILGAAYGYAIFYVPFIYISFLITIFFGIGVGWTIGFTGSLCKVRNGRFMLLFGLIFGIIAEYFGWVFWIHAKTEQALLDFSLGNVLDVMNILSQSGVWSIFDWTPTGGALYAVWVIEALIIIIATVFSVSGKIGSKPFCEDCKKWTKNTIITSQLEPIENISQFVSALENGNFQELFNLNHLGIEDVKRTQIQLLSCTACNNKHYLTIEEITVKLDDKGKPEESEDTIIENLIISNETFEEIKKWSNPLN